MAEEEPNEEPRSRRRRTTAKRGLRRFHNIDSAVVEQTFELTLPSNNAISSEVRNEILGSSTATSNNVGEGCYVSATVHNRRYYGVLVEQQALKAASLLHFQDAASSLDLNRRMKLLQEKKKETVTENGQVENEEKQPSSSTEERAADSAPAKRPLDDSEETIASSGAEDENGQKEKKPSSTMDERADRTGTPAKRPLDDFEESRTSSGADAKRAKVSSEEEVSGQVSGQADQTTTTASVEPDTVSSTNESSSNGHPPPPPMPSRPVQKFRYVDGNSKLPGYRILVATYSNIEAASEGDSAKGKQVEEACQSGGDFVGEFYYQYQVIGTTLQTSNQSRAPDVDIRSSMGFDTFLHTTPMPIWHPLSNLQMGQHKVLSMLQMKKSNKGTIEWDESAATTDSSGRDVFQGTHIPMEPRSRFRVGVLGGGIAGLACATELFRLAKQNYIELEVVILEGRSRLGGRLLTDTETFQCSDGKTPFPVDLGASWIHGIDHNPLATLARESGVDFVTASEEVKMLTENSQAVDPDVDERTGKMLDDILDQAAEDCWDTEEYVPNSLRDQQAVRWYGSVLGKSGPNHVLPRTDAPQHRHSSDVSMDHAIGKAVARHMRREFSKLSKQEHNLLLWNTKNIEYALGANVSDLSMKFWDSDDRHAFEGDHVLLRQGYSSVVEHMVKGLKENGSRFQCVTEFSIGKVEYSRKSTSQPYPDASLAPRKLIDLSDTCCVTSQSDDQSFKFDCLVSTLPLGVLKHSIGRKRADRPNSTTKVDFQPPLPFVKQDAIENVGFGLLNKVYLQFYNPFWRERRILEDGQTLFGNASGFNPQYYMFFDIGQSLGTSDDAPAILMTLVSGKESVDLERKTDKAIAEDVVRTLRKLFEESVVPEPVGFKITRWGSDQFSRGCYSFLPPGATDQDFQILQSPINGNGDSLLLDRAEIMRLFFAGEHTTALHPSTAHGAMLSGIRAAKEVMDTLKFNSLEASDGTDKLIPLAIFREKNPDSTLKCSLCHLSGSRAREGSLLAFQRGARQILVHNNCAEFSPEVEVRDGHWKDVIRAANRGAKLICALCGQVGATAGCTHERCFRSFHFSCAEDTGWRFERDGKEYYCDRHRDRYENGELLYGPKEGECDKISLHFFRTKNPTALMNCDYCGAHGLDKRRGKLLAFQQQDMQILVHDKCARFTNIMDTLEETDVGEKFRNIFEAKRRSKDCTKCGKIGGTVVCSDPSCGKCYHVPCCTEAGWDFRKKGRHFRCEDHRGSRDVAKIVGEAPPSQNGGLFQHNLFSLLGAEPIQKEDVPKVGVAVNAESAVKPLGSLTNGERRNNQENGYSSSDSYSSEEDADFIMQRLSAGDTLEASEIVTIQRRTSSEPWDISFSILNGNGSSFTLSVHAISKEHGKRGLRNGDEIVSINGTKLGSPGLSNLTGVLGFIRGKTSVQLGLGPRKPPALNGEQSNAVKEDGVSAEADPTGRPS